MEREAGRLSAYEVLLAVDDVEACGEGGEGRGVGYAGYEDALEVVDGVAFGGIVGCDIVDTGRDIGVVGIDNPGGGEILLGVIVVVGDNQLGGVAVVVI